MMITRLKQQQFVTLASIFLLLVLVIQRVKSLLKLLLTKTVSGSLEDSRPLINLNKKWSRYDLKWPRITSNDLGWPITNHCLGNVRGCRITMYRSRSWFSLYVRFLWLDRIQKLWNRSRMAHFNLKIIPNRTNCNSNCSHSSKYLSSIYFLKTWSLARQVMWHIWTFDLLMPIWYFSITSNQSPNSIWTISQPLKK